MIHATRLFAIGMTATAAVAIAAVPRPITATLVIVTLMVTLAAIGATKNNP